MEHLGLHAAAHVFFENKLDDMTSEFNGKIKKVQAFVQKELRKLHDIHMGEVKKIKHEVKGKINLILKILFALDFKIIKKKPSACMKNVFIYH